MSETPRMFYGFRRQSDDGPLHLHRIEVVYADEEKVQYREMIFFYTASAINTADGQSLPWMNVGSAEPLGTTTETVEQFMDQYGSYEVWDDSKLIKDYFEEYKRDQEE